MPAFAASVKWILSHYVLLVFFFVRELSLFWEFMQIHNGGQLCIVAIVKSREEGSGSGLLWLLSAIHKRKMN